MCRIRIKGKYRKIIIINIHAPTEDLKMENKEEFYNKLTRTRNSETTEMNENINRRCKHKNRQRRIIQIDSQRIHPAQ